MDVGYKIRDIRVNVYKETSRDFAERCGICKSCLLQIERGEVINPTKKVRRKLEATLGIDLNELSKAKSRCEFTKSQKEDRFRNVLRCISTEMKKSIGEILTLKNEEIYLRDDKYLDGQIAELISLLQDAQKQLKKTDIRTKEEKAELYIDEMFRQGGSISTLAEKREFAEKEII